MNTHRFNVVMSTERKKRKSFDEILLEEAATITDRIEPFRGSSVAESIENEIALTLDQLARLRTLHSNLEHKLLQLEMSADTDMLQIEPRPHDSVDRYRSERLSLKNKIMKIEFERQRLSREQIEKEQVFQNRLFSLLKKLKLLRR